LAFDFLDASEFVQKVYDHANRALGVLTVKSKAAGGLPIQVFTLVNSLLSKIEY